MHFKGLRSRSCISSPGLSPGKKDPVPVPDVIQPLGKELQVYLSADGGMPVRSNLECGKARGGHFHAKVMDFELTEVRGHTVGEEAWRASS
jgi:hypothetical protein